MCFKVFEICCLLKYFHFYTVFIRTNFYQYISMTFETIRPNGPIFHNKNKNLFISAVTSCASEPCISAQTRRALTNLRLRDHFQVISQTRAGYWTCFKLCNTSHGCVPRLSRAAQMVFSVQQPWRVHSAQPEEIHVQAHAVG